MHEVGGAKDEEEVEDTYNSLQMGAYGEKLVNNQLIHEGYKTVAFQSSSTSSGIDLVAYQTGGKLLFVEVKTHLDAKNGQHGLSPSERKPDEFVSNHLFKYAQIDSTQVRNSETKLKAVINFHYVVSNLLHLDPSKTSADKIKQEIIEMIKAGKCEFKLYHVNMGTKSIDSNKWGDR